MKGMDLFCASPASTAICSSSMVRRGTRPIRNRLSVPCSSPVLPINPKPYHHEKSAARKSSDKRRKSSADITDQQLNTPPGSSRYLLSDSPFLDLSSESNSIVPAQAATHPQLINSTDSLAVNSSSSSSSSSSTHSRDQVVVLWVSLHCKGCEGKVRKHIARMEGVTSFSIDLATKKVTIRGDVTPLGVLASVSRVKNALLWPSLSTSSSCSSTSSSTVNLNY